MWFWEQYLLGNKIIIVFWDIFFQSLSERFKQTEREVWINNNNTLRTIHWWPMKFYIRRTYFCSGSWVSIFSQKMNNIGSCVQNFESWILGSQFGPPPPLLAFWFPFKVPDFRFHFFSFPLHSSNFKKVSILSHNICTKKL